MFIVTKCEWEICDSVTLGKDVLLASGRYEVVRIPNPYGHKDPWLLVKGTTMGAAEGWWRDWSDPGYGEYQINVED